jgi:CspA family cold shock protein
VSAERLSGEVVSYSDDRGFGFIRGADGTDYFVRFSMIDSDGYRTLSAGQAVSFLPTADPASGDPQAHEVRLT